MVESGWKQPRCYMTLRCHFKILISPGSRAAVNSTGFGHFAEGEDPSSAEKVFSLTRGGVVFRGPSSFPFAFGFWCEQPRILCWNIYLYGLSGGIIFSRTTMMSCVVPVNRSPPHIWEKLHINRWPMPALKHFIFYKALEVEIWGPG